MCLLIPNFLRKSYFQYEEPSIQIHERFSAISSCTRTTQEVDSSMIVYASFLHGMPIFCIFECETKRELIAALSTKRYLKDIPYDVKQMYWINNINFKIRTASCIKREPRKMIFAKKKCDTVRLYCETSVNEGDRNIS